MTLMSVLYAFTLLFVCNHSCYITAMASEPECMCSRYHYEESLLEKMIRGEIKFEDLKQSVEKGIVGMNAQIADIKHANDEFKQSVLNQQAEIKASITPALEKVEKTLSDLGNVKDSMKIPTIAFSSKQVSDTTLDNNQIIIFSENIYNYGEGYENTTGIFTAPAGGVYMFTVQLCIYYKNAIHFSIVVDGTEITNGYNYDIDAHTCSSATTVTVLKPSEKVWIKSKRKEDKLLQNMHRWNIFSGVLIHQ